MLYAIRAIEFHNVLQEYLLEVSSVWASFTPFWQFWAFFIKCLLSAVGKWDIFLVVKHSQIEPSRAPSLLIWAIGGLNKNGHDMIWWRSRINMNGYGSVTKNLFKEQTLSSCERRFFVVVLMDRSKLFQTLKYKKSDGQNAIVYLKQETIAGQLQFAT